MYYSPIVLRPTVAAVVDQVVDIAAPDDGVDRRRRVPVGVEDDVDGAVPVRQKVVLAVPLLAARAGGALALAVAGHEIPHQDGVQRIAAVSLLKWSRNICDKFLLASDATLLRSYDATC